MNTNSLRRRRGITLIELLLVVGALGLLIIVLRPALAHTQDDAGVATCLSNLRSLMQGTNLYLQDHNDCFPFQVHHDGGTSGISSWSYGGKTNSDYWYSEPWFYIRFEDRPLNVYLLGADIEGDLYKGGQLVQRAEVPVLECPSDLTCYQRNWGIPGAEPVEISSYDDIGTSYHFNLAAVFRRGGLASCDVRKYGMSQSQMGTWLFYQGGWSIMIRDLVRDALYKHPSTYAMYFEDPMDWGLGSSSPKIQVMGNHGAFSWHSMGFLDGHAKNTYVDTRYNCGPDWYALNPEWIRSPNQHPPPQKSYYYTNYFYRNCDHLNQSAAGLP
ncbi:MAG: hypothetical protein KAY37_14510 [Phycisphaerae bacterium]|nr:hypothetical protein [Phycisphaerae bacterium]